jgi:hypothetical protein
MFTPHATAARLTAALPFFGRSSRRAVASSICRISDSGGPPYPRCPEGKRALNSGREGKCLDPVVDVRWSNLPDTPHIGGCHEKAVSEAAFLFELRESLRLVGIVTDARPNPAFDHPRGGCVNQEPTPALNYRRINRKPTATTAALGGCGSITNRLSAKSLEALECLLQTRMDVLVFGSSVLVRQ